MPEAPDHIGAITAAMRRTFTLTCQLGGEKETIEFEDAATAAVVYLSGGWRVVTTDRGDYLLCPECVERRRASGLPVG